MRKALALLSLLVISRLAAMAALPSHVTWTTDIESKTPSSGVIKWTAAIEDGWHIYGLEMPDIKDASMPNPTTITINPAEGLVLDGTIKASVAANTHFDDLLKLNLPWYEGKVTFTQAYTLAEGCTGVNITGTINYMSCTATACTPPAKEKFSITVGEPTAVAADTVTAAATAPVVSHSSKGSGADWWQPVTMEATQGQSATPTSDSPWWVILGLGFLGGLVALLTPCVWPMIPMTVSFFLKKGRSRRRSITDAITYAVSIIVIYLVLGIAITMAFGASKLNDIATSALFNVLFFALLVVFAVSFFGAFEIKLPSRWSNAIDSKAESTTGFLSIFFMAFTLVLVSFSCTGPIIGTLLVEAVSQGSILGPALGMGGFALGMALPFGLFAFFPSMLKEMPKSGSWLNTVKVVLGFIELILSLKFLSVADLAYGWRILDREVFVALWIVLFALMGMYLLGKLRFPHDDDSKGGRVGVGRFFLATASLAFAVYLLPGLWGAPLKSISAFAPPLNTQDFNLYGGTFREFDNYDEGMQYAKDNNMPVIVDFSGYACVNCRKMEGAVFDTERVRNVIEQGYVLIKLMVDDKAPLDEPYTVQEYGGTTDIETVGEQWSYLQRHKFDISSQPYYVLLDNDGLPLAPARVYDENIDAFVVWLEQGLDNYKSKKD
ncbi:MAG: protein-disulfide reductase DsbD family protein [Muribaculaceae bacterium]